MLFVAIHKIPVLTSRSGSVLSTNGVDVLYIFKTKILSSFLGVREHLLVELLISCPVELQSVPVSVTR